MKDQVITELQLNAIDSTLEHARHDYHLDDVATKRDMKELETTLKHDIELLRADTGRLIAESKADLTRWIIGAGFFTNNLDYWCPFKNFPPDITL